jgi:hypothetical protein
MDRIRQPQSSIDRNFLKYFPPTNLVMIMQNLVQSLRGVSTKNKFFFCQQVLPQLFQNEEAIN